MTLNHKTKWWKKFSLASKERRLEMLKERTHRSRTKDRVAYRARRNKKHRPDGPCDVCGGESKCKHHITPIDCGGNSYYENMVNICDKCHCEVHSWMTPDTPQYIIDMDKEFSDILDT